MSTRSERILRRSHQARVGASALLAACLAPSFAAQPLPIAERVLNELQAARRAAGLSEFATRDDLEREARDRARRLAAMPHSQRLATPIEGGLGAAGITDFRRSSVHVDLNRGYHDPAQAFTAGWRRYGQAWQKIMDPGYDAIGVATERGADGFVVLIAILIETGPAPTLVLDRLDLRALEKTALSGINLARRDSGLRSLTVNPVLNGIARARSEEMVRHGYFDHESPTGIGYDDLLRQAGVSFKLSAENLHRNQNVPDPVRTAIDGWMRSEGHRNNMLSAAYLETGLGIAIDDEGALYFTQVFIAP